MPTEFPIRLHWSPYLDQGSPDPAGFIDLCRRAEITGVESVHVPVASCLSEAIALAIVAATETTRVKFRIGWDFGGVLGSLLGGELKDACATLGGRLVVHMSFGNNQAAGNGLFAQAGEFLTNCRGLFRGSESPEFDVEGETAEAAFLAIKQADCLWRLPDRPNQVYADALPVLHFGKQVGLLSSVIARETQQEALDAAAILLPEHAVERWRDSASWITPYLWTGTSVGGNKTAALVGSFEEVARAVHGFKQKGISQFLMRGWPAAQEPDDQELACFGTNVVPLIRGLECGSMAAG